VALPGTESKVKTNLYTITHFQAYIGIEKVRPFFVSHSITEDKKIVSFQQSSTLVVLKNNEDIVAVNKELSWSSYIVSYNQDLI